MDGAHAVPSQWEQELARLREENDSLRFQLEDSQETLLAIQAGAIDALVIDTPDGQRVFTLQGADETYRHLIERMREGAATLTADGIIHFCNRGLADLLKRPLEQVIGTPILQYIANADQPFFGTLLCQGLGGHAGGEVGLTASDGGTIATQIGLSPLSDGGVAPSLSMIVFDLSERRRADAILASEQFIRRVIDNSPIGVAVVDRDLRYVLANSAYQAIAERPLIGHTIAEVFSPAVAEIVQPPVEQVLGSGQAMEIRGSECPIRGRTWWNISAIPLRAAGGTTEAVLILTQDVTEQKRAEETLRESELRFRTMGESIPQLAWMAQPDGHIFWYNRRWYEYTGTTPEQMEGWGWQTVHDPEELPRVLKRWQAAIAQGIPWEDTFPLRRHDGAMRPHLSRAVPIRDPEGRVTRWFGTNTDITERIEMERALQHAKESAEAANVAKSQFLANMSHELRTPMNAILGMIDVALSKALSPIVQDCLQTAKGSAELLLTLLNDLLDTARIEAGKLELESAPFSLRRLLDQMTRVLAMRASEKGLAFYCRIPEETPDAVIGDRMRLQQVLLNLAGNAIKFTERGEVEIRVGQFQISDAEPEICTLPFAVRDTGIGVPPADQERLFQPFIQADASVTRRFGGTGLGLSISKSLVEGMEGRIWVQSEVGQGSTFYFTVRLSLAKELPPDFDTPAAFPTAAPSPLRILLVEDNPANQKLATYLLKDRGHLLEIAGDGQEAINLTEQNRYDVILMDVEMPGTNGLEATAAIRKRETSGRRVPIIAMTAYAMKGDRERCLEAGMDAYLSKPIDGLEMIALVETLAAGASPAAVSGDPSLSAPPRHIDPPAAPLIDFPVMLTRCFNNPKIVGDMIECFHTEVDTVLPEIHSALEKGDLVEVGRLGHRLKGTVVYLGAEVAVKAAANVERLYHGGKGQAEAEEAVRALEHQCQLLKKELASRPFTPRPA